jgi:hypothetical protein
LTPPQARAGENHRGLILHPMVFRLAGGWPFKMGGVIASTAGATRISPPPAKQRHEAATMVATIKKAHPKMRLVKLLERTSGFFA